METLEQQFNSRVRAFLGRTGLSPTTFGMKALGDPNLMRPIDGARSLSLRTADRVLAFMADYDLDSGGPRTPPRGHRRRKPSSRARRTRRSERSRRSGSNPHRCPSGCTGEPPARPGATSRSNCPSRWTRAAPCSSTSIPATTPRPRSAPGARRTAGSGTRSRDKAGPSRSSPSRAPPGSSSEPDAGIREELARIDGAILQGAVQILEEFGGLQAAMKRSVVLEKQVRRQPGPGSIRRASTWRTVRLAGARYR